MITHDQLLPSLYQMQRQGRIGEISVCALNRRTILALAEAEGLRAAFPGQTFPAVSRTAATSDRAHPDLYRELIARLPPRQIVVVAVPDQMHYDAIMTALRHDQHVCTVKPLVLTPRAGARDRARGLPPRAWWWASSTTSASTTAA